MAIPGNKKQLQEAMRINYQKLRAELSGITQEQARQEELEGHGKGTTMSVCNLVAYLLGWGELVLKWNRLKESGAVVDFPETGYKWNELGALAQKFYTDYREDPYPALLTKLDQTVSELAALVASKTDQELYGTGWYDKWTLGRMIQLNTSSPYLNAKGRIRKWKKTKGIK